MNYLPLLQYNWPDLVVVITLFFALGIDYGLLRNADLLKRSRNAAGICQAGLLFAFGGIILQISQHTLFHYGDGQIVLAPLTLAFKALIFGLAIFVVGFSARLPTSPHVSEYYALILLSTLGMGFLITTNNLLMLFVALETMSLSLYAMTAFRKNSLLSAEAAVKYFAFGGISSAFLLFGLSYLYGSFNTLDIAEISRNQVALLDPSPLLLVAFVFILVGLGFKIAVAPFHLWAPDAYQSAPTTAAAWIATGSKIASFFILVKILLPTIGYPLLQKNWNAGLAGLAVLSLLVGNIGALRQHNLKRLLAYSSIGQAGYILIGLIASSREGMTSVLFYIVVYSLANLGAFGLVALLNDRLGREAEISDFAGCHKSHPELTLLFMIFVLSLAGIPPLGGFVGKYYLFFTAIQSRPIIVHWYDGCYWLVGLALITSAIALYYYLKILKAAVVSDETIPARVLPITLADSIGLFLLAFLVLLLGIFPAPVIHFITANLAQ